jgi:hypothetical protein
VPLIPSPAWPTPSHELLLRAALCDPQPARQAWEQWNASHRLDDVDTGALRLLPQIYANLKSVRAKYPESARLAGIYRQSWTANHLRVARTARAIAALADAGVETLVLKGLALQALAYPSMGARMMADGDVLVARSQATEAARVLRRDGWSLDFEPFERELRCRASTAFSERDGTSLDLHWHVLADDQRGAAEDRFWQASQPFELGGVPTRTLSVGHHLLHAVVHGLAWALTPPVSWVTDAVRLLRQRGTQVDWPDFWATSRACGVDFVVVPALRYIERVFPDTFADATRRTITAATLSRRDRFHLFFRLRGRGFLPGYLVKSWQAHQALPGERYGHGIVGYTRFCCDVLRVDGSPRSLLRAVAARARRR